MVQWYNGTFSLADSHFFFEKLFIQENCKEHSELVSDTTQLKLTAPDGKKYNSDVISQAGVEEL